MISRDEYIFIQNLAKKQSNYTFICNQPARQDFVAATILQFAEQNVRIWDDQLFACKPDINSYFINAFTSFLYQGKKAKILVNHRNSIDPYYGKLLNEYDDLVEVRMIESLINNKMDIIVNDRAAYLFKFPDPQEPNICSMGKLEDRIEIKPKSRSILSLFRKEKEIVQETPCENIPSPGEAVSELFDGIFLKSYKLVLAV